MWRPGLVLAGAAALALPFVAHSLTVSEGARPLAEAFGWLLAADPLPGREVRSRHRLRPKARPSNKSVMFP